MLEGLVYYGGRAQSACADTQLCDGRKMKRQEVSAAEARGNCKRGGGNNLGERQSWEHGCTEEAGV